MAVTPKQSPIREPDASWYLVGLLFVLYSLSFLDRQIIALMVEPIKRDLEITDFQFSLLHGFAFSLFYTLLGLPFGWAADRYSRRSLIYFGATAWSFMTMLCGLAGSFIQLFLARVGVGVGEATLSPSAYSLIGDSYSEEKLPRAMSLYASGSIFGAGFALIFGGMLLGFVGNAQSVVLPLLGELRTWQFVFILCGLPGVFFALLMFTVKEPTRKERKTDNVRDITILNTLKFVVKNRKAFGYHFAGFSLLSIVGFGFASWSPAFLIRVHGYTPQEAGLTLGLMLAIFGPLSALVIGGMIKTMTLKGFDDAPLRLYGWLALALVPTSVLAYVVPSQLVNIVFLGVLVFLVVVFSGPAVLALKKIIPNEMRGQTTALFILTINFVGLGLGPSIIALATDFLFGDEKLVGYSLGLVSALAALAAAGLLLRGKRYFAAAA